MQKILEKNNNSYKIAFDEAINYLKNGKIISFASDTVYGFAVDASNEKAVAKLYELKKRDKNKPVAIFLPNFKIAQEIFVFSDLAQKFIQKFADFSTTLILKKRPDFSLKIAKNINQNDDFLGFRVVNCDFLKYFFENSDIILAVTSANISGEKPLILAQEVYNIFNNQDILLIDGGICKNKIPSTVVKIDENKISILREGILKKQKIEDEIYN